MLLKRYFLSFNETLRALHKESQWMDQTLDYTFAVLSVSYLLCKVYTDWTLENKVGGPWDVNLCDLPSLVEGNGSWHFAVCLRLDDALKYIPQWVSCKFWSSYTKPTNAHEQNENILEQNDPNLKKSSFCLAPVQQLVHHYLLQHRISLTLNAEWKTLVHLSKSWGQNNSSQVQTLKSVCNFTIKSAVEWHFVHKIYSFTQGHIIRASCEKMEKCFVSKNGSHWLNCVSLHYC